MRDILFMGEILASVTHDMQNVMAIIKESGALAEDIIALNSSLCLKHGEKIGSALCNIREQVARGRNLMIMLNGFAHAAEDFPGACDLGRFAEQIGVLATRMVRMKECDLVLEPCSEPLMVRGNALLLMQSLYLGLYSLLETCSAGDVLSVHITSRPDFQPPTATLHIRTRDSRLMPQCGITLARLLEELDGHCSISRGTVAVSFRLLDGSEAGAL